VRVFGIQKCRKVKENPGEWSQVKRVRWKSRLHQDILSPPFAPPLSNRENEGGIGVVKGRGQRGRRRRTTFLLEMVPKRLLGPKTQRAFQEEGGEITL
jgi:hypothetical protein